MIDIRFYHLESTTVYETLPTLLQKVADMGIRGTVVVPAEMKMKVSECLWQFGQPTNFIAHDIDGDTAPFVLEDIYDNTRSTLFSVDSVDVDIIEKVELLCFMFHGRDEEILSNARRLWKTWTAKEGVSLSYYQQNVSGGWVKKA